MFHSVYVTMVACKCKYKKKKKLNTIIYNSNGKKTGLTFCLKILEVSFKCSKFCVNSQPFNTGHGAAPRYNQGLVCNFHNLGKHTYMLVLNHCRSSNVQLSHHTAGSMADMLSGNSFGLTILYTHYSMSYGAYCIQYEAQYSME